MSRTMPQRSTREFVLRFPDGPITVTKRGTDWHCPRLGCYEKFRRRGELEKHAAGGECLPRSQRIRLPGAGNQEATQETPSTIQGALDYAATVNPPPTPPMQQTRGRQRPARRKGPTTAVDNVQSNLPPNELEIAGTNEPPKPDRVRLRIPGAASLSPRESTDIYFIARRTQVDDNGMDVTGDEKMTIDVDLNDVAQSVQATAEPQPELEASSWSTLVNHQSLLVDPPVSQPPVADQSIFVDQIVQPVIEDQATFAEQVIIRPVNTNQHVASSTSAFDPATSLHPDNAFLHNFRSLSVADGRPTASDSPLLSTPPPPEFPITPMSMRDVSEEIDCPTSSPDTRVTEHRPTIRHAQSLSYITPPPPPPQEKRQRKQKHKEELLEDENWLPDIHPVTRKFFASLQVHEGIDFYRIAELFEKFGFADDDDVLGMIAQYAPDGVWDSAEMELKEKLNTFELAVIMEGLRRRAAEDIKNGIVYD